MNHRTPMISLITRSRYLSILAGGCTVIAIATLLSCETPTHLREDFGASYREAIRVQTDRDHVRRSVAGSSLDGRAASSLYEGYIERYRQAGDSTRPSDPLFSLPPTGSSQGGISSTSSQAGAMPTGESKP